MAASQPEGVQWEAEPVLRMVDHLGQQYGTIVAGAGDVLEALGDVAEQLAAAGRQGEVGGRFVACEGAAVPAAIPMCWPLARSEAMQATPPHLSG